MNVRTWRARRQSLRMRTGFHPVGHVLAVPVALNDKETTESKNGRCEGLPESALQTPRRSDSEQRVQDDAQVSGGDIRLDLLRDLSSSSYEEPSTPRWTSFPREQARPLPISRNESARASCEKSIATS